MESTLDSIFKSAVEARELPGVAAIALDATGSVLYSNGFGRISIDDPESSKITTTTPLTIFSCTKLFTAVAALKLLEEGRLSLQDPVAKYCPEIAEIPILKGLNEDGSPETEKAKNETTILHLFTHTAGFSYDFFEMDTLRVRLHREDMPGASMTAVKEYYNAPRIHEAGEKYTYGLNTDWLGFVVEAITGMSLPEYIDETIVQPLGLKNTRVSLTAEESKELFLLHMKDPSGKLSLGPLIRDPTAPLEVNGGGDCLFSTAEDLAQFFLVFLNKGTHPVSGVTILKPETVDKYLFTDLLPSVGCSNDRVGAIPSSIPPITSTGSFLPGVEKGWSAGLLINNEALPNGRSKGSGAWAGLGNLYYWIDPTAGKLGLVASSYFPFFDKSALHLTDALERAVYGKPMASEMGEKGSNFECDLPNVASKM